MELVGLCKVFHLYENPTISIRSIHRALKLLRYDIKKAVMLLWHNGFLYNKASRLTAFN
jgi:hypothetical protein